jgi:RNA polymerase sigma factor (sigma-70 family)
LSDTQPTIELLGLARAGRADALNALFARCLPPLRRWAQGRLPAVGRDLFKTGDLVQDTVVSVLGRLNTFEAHQEGALLAHLREAVMNRIADVSRRFKHPPAAAALDSGHADTGRSPLEQTIGAERMRQYDAALQRLSPLHRQAVIARLELQYSYEQIAEALGRPNASAARALVVRALYRLYQELPHAE